MHRQAALRIRGVLLHFISVDIFQRYNCNEAREAALKAFCIKKQGASFFLPAVAAVPVYFRRLISVDYNRLIIFKISVTYNNRLVGVSGLYICF